MTEITADDIDGALVPSFRSHVFAVEVDDETVLLDERHLLLHVMNGTASVIVSQVGRGRTAGEIAEVLAATFNVDVEVVTSDVLTLVRELGRLGLLEGVSGAPDQDGVITD